MSEFTALQLKQWAAFERVRAGGRFNMFDPRARAATGLDDDDYLFVMENYTELKEAEEKVRA
jgi:hypothetical protein